MRILVAAAAIACLASCRCGGEPARSGGGERAASTAATDALWALAPAGARGGLVASPRAVAMAERAVADVRGMLERVPELAPWRGALDELLRDELGIASPSLEELGLTSTRGLALFLVPDGMVAILPVADRARFLARAAGVPGSGGGSGAPDRIGGATCREVRGAYACATSEALLGTLGRGDLGQRLAGRARGDVEIVGLELPLGGPTPGAVTAAVQLERGALVVRGTVTGAAPALTARVAGAHRPRLDPQRSSGFAVADVAALAAGGAAVDALLRALRGPLSVSVPAGRLALEADQALADPAAVRALLERCPELVEPLAIRAEHAAGTCRMTLPASGLALDAWIEGDLLRIGRRGEAIAGEAVPLTPFGAELARGTWGAALWGRGTLLRAAALPAAPPDVLAEDAVLSIRALALVEELGAAVRREPDGALSFALAVRTTFANPDEVVARLLAIPAADIAAGRAAAAARPIAEAHPGAPFAADFAAGEVGLLIPTTVLNVAIRSGLPALLRRAPRSP